MPSWDEDDRRGQEERKRRQVVNMFCVFFDSDGQILVAQPRTRIQAASEKKVLGTTEDGAKERTGTVGSSRTLGRRRHDILKSLRVTSLNDLCLHSEKEELEARDQKEREREKQIITNCVIQNEGERGGRR